MKKNLLFAVGIGLFFSASAQSQIAIKKFDYAGKRLTKIDGINFSVLGQQQSSNVNRPSFDSRSTTKVGFTGSRNAFGLIVAESNCLTANQQLNAVMFTHRISNEFNLPNDNNGYIQNTFSTNFGTSWDSIIQTNSATNLCRYPSGAIFNPSGNTNIDSAFATVTGPITPTSTGWVGNYFSSARLDSTNINASYLINTNPGFLSQWFVRIGATATDLKTIVTGSLYSDVNAATVAAQGYRGATINYATPGTNNDFIWTVDSIVPAFLKNSSGTNYASTIAQTAWNKAGNIGYVVFNGIDSAASGTTLAFAPIVYKTTDAGATWTKLPLFDFSTIPAIAERLVAPSDGGDPTPFFTGDKGVDVAVDENGELHIFNTISSAAFAFDVDQLDTWQGYAPADEVKTFYMYDTYTTGGTWNSLLVDSMNTDNSTDYSPFNDDNGQFPIDARMQMSRSDDGSKLFYFWLDSPPTVSNQVENCTPDIFGRGFDVTNRKWTATKKFTSDNLNYFMYISNLALQNGTLYKIPATVSLPTQWPTSGDLLMPMRHYFVSGIEFDQSEFVVDGTTELAKVDAFEVSNNVPNPFNQQTLFNIKLTETAHVTIDIINTLGTTVASFDKGNLSMGMHKVAIDGSDLASGIYFYTVKAGNNSVSRKMMVRK
jgi:hypothetical protein